MLTPVRVLICDAEDDLSRMVEAIAARQSHQVVGMAGTFHAAEMLIGSTKPEIVILDPALGYGSDYDLIEEAEAVGAQVVVFSHTARELSLERYDQVPTIVDKPNLDLLEEVLRTIRPIDTTPAGERRERPQRAAGGRAPVGPSDTPAFFEAISSAVGGDVLVWIDFSAVARQMDAEVVHRMISGAAREGDRLVLSPTSIRGYLPAAGEKGMSSFWRRLEERDLLLPGVTVHAVVINEGEHPNDAFDRLRGVAGA